MTVTIHIVDAFTQVVGQGNRAGVVLDAAGLSSAQMQEIAIFAGYSETAFVLPAQDKSHDLQVRYFTPGTEVPICGHATVATHFLRVQMAGLRAGRQQVLTGAGVLPIEVRGAGAEAHIVMTQGKPEFGLILQDRQKMTLLAGLGIGADDLRETPVQVVSTGHSKVMIPLKSKTQLDGLTPDMPVLAALGAEIECNGFFPFVIGTGTPFHTFGRMFAPAIGIAEDPVTGNANGPAGAYLHRYGVLAPHPRLTYAGHQGQAMGKFGTIKVTLTEMPNSGLQVQIGGGAVYAGKRVFTSLSK